MKFDSVYVIFRRYGTKSTDATTGKPNIRLYGWTPSKATMKAFFKQRSKEKYAVKKVDSDELFANKDGWIGESVVRDIMIDTVKLRSNSLCTDVMLLTTFEEKIKFESMIQTMMSDLCSLSRIWMEGLTNTPMISYVNFITHLDDKYLNALNLIGYKPKEINDVYNSVEETDIYGNDSYGSFVSGESTHDLTKNVIYSLESVIHVLRDEF